MFELEEHNSATLWNPNNSSNLISYQPLSVKRSKQLSFDLNCKRNKIKIKPSNVQTSTLRNTVLAGKNPWVSEPKSASQRVERAVHQSIVIKKSGFTEQNIDDGREMDTMRIEETGKIKAASDLANKLKSRAVDILDKLNSFKTQNDEALAILNSMEDEYFETC